MRRRRHTGNNRRECPIVGHRTAASEMVGRLEWVDNGLSLVMRTIASSEGTTHARCGGIRRRILRYQAAPV